MLDDRVHEQDVGNAQGLTTVKGEKGDLSTYFAQETKIYSMTSTWSGDGSGGGVSKVSDRGFRS